MNEKIKKVERAMKGFTWEDAHDIGVHILGKYVAFKAHKENGFNFANLLKEIADRGDRWVKEEGGAHVIAMSNVII